MNTAEEKEENRFDRRVKLLALAIPFITLFLGTAVGYGLTQYSNRLRVLPCYVSSSPSLFPRPDIVGRRLAVTLDNRPIDNLCSITIFIASSDQDLVDVPIHLRFMPIDGLAPKVIQVRSSLMPEQYRETPLPDVMDGSVRRGYVIGVWNRGMAVQFDCLFEGGKPPEVSVDTMIKGVVVKRMSTPELIEIKLPFWDRVLFTLLVALGVAAFFWLEIKLLDWVLKRPRKLSRK